METTNRNPAPSEEAMAEMRRLHHQGRSLAAYERSQAYGPLSSWRDTAARILAGRLAIALGGWRLGSLLHHVVARTDPDHSDARYYGLLARWQRRGPFETWESWSRMGERPQDAPRLRAQWWALGATLSATLRDTSRADRAIRLAQDLSPEESWIWVETSSVRQLEDRPEEALEAAERALALSPHYPPAIQAVVRSYLQLNRTDDALRLLTQVAELTESGTVIALLANLQGELEMYVEARRNWERVERLMPLLEEKSGGRDWLKSRLADACYDCGDFDRALVLAEQCKFPYYQRFAEQLRTGPRDLPRRKIPVGFVRQRHMTCAPATLTAISHYWSKPVDHLDVAEQICYDGTPAHSERQWAEQQGFHVREFRVTWDNTRALIDAGIPFTLTTVTPGAAHLQAVIGYDALAETILVRDPMQRMHVAFLAQELLESQSASGPRGMLLVPPDQQDKVRLITLDEAEWYDEYSRLQLALERHDRPAAQACLDRLVEQAPGHRLRFWAARSLAAYDSNTLGGLEALDQLLRLYPQEVNLNLAKLSCLRELGRRSDRLQMLRDLCDYSSETNRAASASPPTARASSADVLSAMRKNRFIEPMFLLEYAWELSEDSRQDGVVEWLARRSLRCRPQDGTAVRLLANIRWNQNARDEAWELFRLAACLEGTDEGNAKTFFIASRHLKRVSEALEFLHERVHRFGKLSAWPARTLSNVYEQLEQSEKALETLEEAMRLHPDDGPLMLAAANFALTYGQYDRAAELLQRAKDRVHADAWLRAAARQAECLGDRPHALELWRQVIEHQPLAIDSHRSIVELLASTEGESSAIAHIDQALERFPENNALHTMRVEWSRQQTPEEHERVARRMLDVHPDDSFAHRELASALYDQSRWDETLAALDGVRQFDPLSPFAPLLRGQVYRARGQRIEAQDSFRESLRLSVDCAESIDALLSTCDTKQERVAALRFVIGELVRQVNFGEGLVRFHAYASASLDPPELIQVLRDAQRERPDLWQSWLTLGQALADAGQHDEAQRIAEQGVEQFPLVPRLWLNLARIHGARGQIEDQRKAIEHALEINPGFSDAERALCRFHRARSDLDAAQHSAERAVRWEPRDFRNHALLAETLWDRGEKPQALDALRRALDLEPGFEHGWEQMATWAWDSEQPQLAIDAATSLTRNRPHESRSWMVLADMLARREDRAEMFAAIDKAIELNPRNDELYSRKAYWLSMDEKFDEALEACSPAVFDGHPPIALRSRTAQIIARRGDLPQAIDRMREVLNDDPDYAWAWLQLVDWYRQLERYDDYLHAAEQLVRVSPDDPRSFGYRGDAHLRLSQQSPPQRELALQDFRCAIDLDLSYDFASRSLIEELLTDGQAQEAEAILARVENVYPPALVLGFRCRSAGVRRDLPTFQKLFRELLPLLGDDTDPFYVVVAHTDGWGWDDEIAELLFNFVLQNGDHPEFAHAWAHFALERGNHEAVRRRLSELERVPDAWPHGAARLLEYYRTHSLFQDAKGWIDSYRRQLRAHDRSWAETASLLWEASLVNETVAWMQDWNSRQQVDSATLLILAIGLRWNQRDADAHGVSLAAVERPTDRATHCHRIWLAVDACLAGDDERAHQILSECPADGLDDYYQALTGMVRAVLAEPGSPLAFPAADGQLQATVAKTGNDRVLRRVLNNCRIHVARQRGQWWRAIWWRLRQALR